MNRLTAGGFDERTLKNLEQALGCVNLSVRDLGWDKRPITDEFRLACVNETLDSPLSLADRAIRAETEFAADPVASARAAAAWLDLKLPASEASGVTYDRRQPDDRRFAGAPREAVPLLSLLVDAYERASRLREEAMASLDVDERKRLIESGARLYTDESEEDWDMTPILAAARKVDLGKLVQAELVMARASTAALVRARTIDGSRWKSRRWRIGPVTVGLGSPGPDMHSEAVVLDPGGDDVYAGSKVILDVSGDDLYRNSGLALFDVALIVDLAGDDRYIGRNFSQGGAAFGASLLVDASGDDRYEADQCSQGSAFFGIGLLFDLAGSDAYRGARFVQGFGGTRGLGALSDVAGNDTYYAGGKYRHAPLLPENYQSLSQGFGFGLRSASASGGIGILVDHTGSDVYSGEVFAQGASYWFSLGILVDSEGHDKYNLYQYGQGAGIHLSAGVLFDRAGNDGYTCNNGVAQGSGHDWGVGLLWDLAGDDGYQGSGMSQGGVNANGVGMLIEGAGNDSYAGWNVKNQGDAFFSRGTIGLGVLLDLGGSDRYTHGGKDNSLWTRGTVGVGFDLEPKKGPEDSGRASGSPPPGQAPTAEPAPHQVSPTPAASSVVSGTRGAGEAKGRAETKNALGGRSQEVTTAPETKTAPEVKTAKGPLDESRPGPADGSTGVTEPSAAGIPKISESGDLPALWHDACLWEVGSNAERVPEARQALVREGEGALGFLIPSKLKTKDTLVTRALNVVITRIGKSAVPPLIACLGSDDPDVRRNAADLLGALGATEAAPAIAKLLVDPDARLGALSALGVLKSPEAVGSIVELMESDAPERVRYTAVATLGAIGGDRAVRALVPQLASTAAPVRYAAQFALEQIKATAALRGRLEDRELSVRLHAIAGLGHIADRAARIDLARLLDDPSPVVRGFAAEALASMLDPSDRFLLQSHLAAETDPFPRGKLEAALADARLP